MKHVKTITAQEAPARAALLANYNPFNWPGHWIAEALGGLGAWKALIAAGLNDNVDPEDIVVL